MSALDAPPVTDMTFTPRKLKDLLLLCLLVAPVTCSCERSARAPNMADMQVHLRNAEGQTVGVLSIAEVAEGVRFIGWANNLPSGAHSVRVYRGAVCDQLATGRDKADGAEELYFGDMQAPLTPLNEAAEVGVTVPGHTVSSLSSGSGSSIVVIRKNGSATQNLACGVIRGG